MGSAVLKDNTDAHRFELIVDGAVVGEATYSLSGNTMTITHTEVSAEYKGKGYASELARQALDSLRAKQMKLIPACQFIASFIQKHQEYADLTKA